MVTMQGQGATAGYMMALTAVLLQAAIADPDLVQAHLADQHCWPALLAVCKPQRTASATQHAHHISQLSCSSHVHSSDAHEFPSDTQQAVQPTGYFADLPTGGHITASDAEQQQQQQTTEGNCRQGITPRFGAGRIEQDGELAWAGYEAHAAAAASHVAQLITVLIQSQPEQAGAATSYAGTDALGALLHCYSVHGKTAACHLAAPVWPQQAQRQRQQHAMLQFVAEAGRRRSIA